MEWRPASEAPYDEICTFYTDDGHIVEGFIYDGDETDFGYIGWLKGVPDIPDWLDDKIRYPKEECF